MIKSTAKGGIRASLTADKAKATLGAQHARERLGVVKDDVLHKRAGPIQFPARYKGQKGHAYITVTATTPAVSWTSSLEHMNPAWTVAVADIKEVKKLSGLGWKSKAVVGWALDKEIVGGLIVKT